LSVSGISAKAGITSSCLQETDVNNLMIRHCRGKRIVIADGSKFGLSWNFVSDQLSDIDILITDSSADPHELDPITSLGISVILADLSSFSTQATTECSQEAF